MDEKLLAVNSDIEALERNDFKEEIRPLTCDACKTKIFNVIRYKKYTSI